MLLRVILLVCLVRILMLTDKPFLCSGIYAAVVFLFGLVLTSSFVAVLLGSIIAFALASLYFWLLSRFEGTGLAWWAILIVGFAVGLI